MGMVEEAEQTFEGIMSHWKSTFQSWKTISTLISNFYSWSKKQCGSEDVFGYNLQILVCKIIACKPAFKIETNKQLIQQ